MFRVEYFCCAFLIVTLILLFISIMKKRERYEQLIVCNRCNKYGCQGPRQCQPPNAYFTNLYDLMMSRLSTIPREYNMELLVQDYRNYNMFMDRLEDINERIQGMEEFLTAIAAQQAAVKKAEVKTEVKAETKPIEKFGYGDGRIIVLPPILPEQPYFLSEGKGEPYISGLVWPKVRM